MAFWDTSALIKLYVRERDSDHFADIIRNSQSRAAISQLTLSEMRCALLGKEFARAIAPNMAELIYREFRDDVEAATLKVIPYGRDVQDEFDRIVRVCYRAKPVVLIRALDGLLLASALTAKVPDLVTTDSRMRDAGVLLGLRILPA